MGRFFQGLWRHPDFLKLWAGQTVSIAGSGVTMVALPLTAVLTLHASAFQMGIIVTCQSAPALLGMFVGAWVDRLRRRRIMIATDLFRVALLSAIPVALFLGQLRIELLYVVAVLMGTCAVVFGVSYQSYLPSLITREEIVEANTKLEAGRSTAQVTGPTIAGFLVQILGAPMALVIDASSYIVSAVSLLLIRRAEPASAPRPKRNIWAEVWEGLHFVGANPLLRAIAGCTSTWYFFGSLQQAVFVLFVTQELRIAPALIGVIFASRAVGGLLGVFLHRRVTGWLSLGPALATVVLVGTGAFFLSAVAGGPMGVAVAFLIASQFLMFLCEAIYSISQISLRQAITPQAMQGRMNATMRFLSGSSFPAGALLGGVLGQLVGLRGAMLIAAVGAVFACSWVLSSPLRSLTQQPAAVAQAN